MGVSTIITPKRIKEPIYRSASGGVIYTVPEGKVLYITDIIICGHGGSSLDQHDSVSFSYGSNSFAVGAYSHGNLLIMGSPAFAYGATTSGANMHYHFDPPLKVIAGTQIIHNLSQYGIASIAGWLEDA